MAMDSEQWAAVDVILSPGNWWRHAGRLVLSARAGGWQVAAGGHGPGVLAPVYGCASGLGAAMAAAEECAAAMHPNMVERDHLDPRWWDGTWRRG